MAKKKIDFRNVIKYYKNYTHQNQALETLSNSLTEDQVNKFYSQWYGDTTRVDNVPTETVNYFDLAYSFTSQWEGGYVDHPADPGGATNLGVTQNTYNQWRKSHGLPLQSVSYLTKQEAIDIFFNNYWLMARCDELGLPLNIVLFDTVVNFGVSGGITFLQEVVGVTQDGILGPITMQAIKRSTPMTIALEIIATRKAYRAHIVTVNPSLSVFYDGWINRDNALLDFIRSICKSRTCQ